MSYTNNLIDFIQSSPTAHHTVRTLKEALIKDGFTEVFENDPKAFSDGNKHFVIRGGTSLIAFKGQGDGFVITASHSDSPSFKVKSEMSGTSYVKLATEKYGGMIHYSWLDRALSVAGRVVVKNRQRC